MTISSAREHLYLAARVLGDVAAVTSGSPRKVARRAANHGIGRALGRAGVWRALWGTGR